MLSHWPLKYGALGSKSNVSLNVVLFGSHRFHLYAEQQDEGYDEEENKEKL